MYIFGVDFPTGDVPMMDDQQPLYSLIIYNHISPSFPDLVRFPIPSHDLHGFVAFLRGILRLSLHALDQLMCLFPELLGGLLAVPGTRQKGAETMGTPP